MPASISIELTANAAGVEFTDKSVSFHGPELLIARIAAGSGCVQIASQLLDNAGREELSTPVLTITGAKD